MNQFPDDDRLMINLRVSGWRLQQRHRHVHLPVRGALLILQGRSWTRHFRVSDSGQSLSWLPCHGDSEETWRPFCNRLVNPRIWDSCYRYQVLVLKKCYNRQEIFLMVHSTFLDFITFHYSSVKVPRSFPRSICALSASFSWDLSTQWSSLLLQWWPLDTNW